jgi:hypothetical protein
MILDIDFLINFFTKHTYTDIKDEMGEQDSESSSASGGSIPKWSDSYTITRGKANMLGLAGEKHSTGLTRGVANQIW